MIRGPKKEVLKWKGCWVITLNPRARVNYAAFWRSPGRLLLLGLPGSWPGAWSCRSCWVTKGRPGRCRAIEQVLAYHNQPEVHSQESHSSHLPSGTQLLLDASVASPLSQLLDTSGSSGFEFPLCPTPCFSAWNLEVALFVFIFALSL